MTAHVRRRLADRARVATPVCVCAVAALGGVVATGAFTGTEAGSTSFDLRKETARTLVAEQRIAFPATAPPRFSVAMAPMAPVIGPESSGWPALVSVSSLGEPTVVICGAADSVCDTTVSFGAVLRRETVGSTRITVGLFVPSAEDPASLRGLSLDSERYWQTTPFVTQVPAYLTG